jgi:hypothetical protein
MWLKKEKNRGSEKLQKFAIMIFALVLLMFGNRDALAAMDYYIFIDGKEFHFNMLSDDQSFQERYYAIIRAFSQEFDSNLLPLGDADNNGRPLNYNENNILTVRVVDAANSNKWVELIFDRSRLYLRGFRNLLNDNTVREYWFNQNDVPYRRGLNGATISRNRIDDAVLSFMNCVNIGPRLNNHQHLSMERLAVFFAEAARFEYVLNNIGYALTQWGDFDPVNVYDLVTNWQTITQNRFNLGIPDSAVYEWANPRASATQIVVFALVAYIANTINIK